MNFFSGLFNETKRSESVALIDVGADSVAGAYVRYTEGELPVLLHSRRLPVEIRKEESPKDAVLRTLEILGNTLIREGAPILVRAVGNGKLSTILVSINAPWQETQVRIEHFEENGPFVFTRDMVASTLKKTTVVPEGRFLADESIIGTLLNGYKTQDPYGKKIHRASVIVLTSLIDREIANSVVSIFRSLYHTKRVLPIAGSSLRFQALRAAFPHERDALILDATGPLTSIALLRRDHFADSIEVPGSDTKSGDSWIQKVVSEFDKIAKKYPLPRMIFLLAQEPEIAPLRGKLDTADLGELWLSDSPPKIVSVLVSHLSGLVQQAAAETPDLLILLMALYWQHRAPDESI